MVEMMKLEETGANLGRNLDGVFNNPPFMDVPDGSQSVVAPIVSLTATSEGGKKKSELMSYTKEKGTKMEDLHKNLNDELAQLPLNLKQRIRALRLLTKDDTLVRIFYEYGGHSRANRVD
ncbi:hypothetical protein Dimus_019907 [Dionaea muscipula]